jgi:hypothetical protein
MFKSMLRWLIPLGGLIVVGPLAGLCTYGLRATDGSSAATPMLSESPMMGMLRGIVALALAGGVGIVGTMVNGVRAGVFAAGLVLAWAAWGTGNMDDVIRHSQSGGVLWKLSVEGVVFGLLAVGLAVGLVRLGKAREAGGARRGRRQLRLRVMRRRCPSPGWGW